MTSEYISGKRHPCVECGHVSAIKGRRCAGCSVEREIKKMEHRNAVQKAARQAADAAKPPKFCEDGCGTQIKHKSKMCPACAKKKRRQRENAAHKAVPVKALPPHRPPKAEPKPAMTDEERDALDAKQRLFDLQVNDRLNERMARSLGFNYEPGKPLASPVKVFTSREIAAIQEELTAPRKTRELPHYVFR